MIVTIDGPAGAGKSSAARALARRLGFRFLDTGAMYRAVALAVARRQLDWHNSRAVAQLAEQLTIELTETQVLLDGEDVTDAIRTPEVTAHIHHVADNERVRDRLGQLQRRAAAERNIVTEGRDQGTVVFPDAECKIFLTASARERAMRRQQDLEQRGESLSLEEVLDQQNERDRRDEARKVGRLERADDAVELCTDGLALDEVVDRLEQLVRQKARSQPT